jgi:high-affinity iron transporter
MVNGGGGWGIFNALFGWTNSATYGSVIGYNMYWIVVIIAFFALRYNETHGRWPLMKKRAVAAEAPGSDGKESLSSHDIEKHGVVETKTEPHTVSEIAENKV